VEDLQVQILVVLAKAIATAFGGVVIKVRFATTWTIAQNS